jgi:hypothetical protein
MNILPSIIPVTVVVAVGLFAAKECIEFVRRYKGESRKKDALRALLARECELNNWTIKSIKHIVETIRDESEDDTRTEFSFLFTKAGKVLFRFKQVNEEFKGGMSLGNVHSDIMNKHLLEVAMYDKELFEVLQPAFDALAELEHVRDSLIYFVEPEDDQDKLHLDGFIQYALREVDVIFCRLDRLYVECTGTKLKAFKIR